ncbi:unnamed protein product [[Candida] boidinii]|uniref:Unnamed protein product n=1 Tax=Candida boidinii TaxID=5477 RepID=A0ACB5TMB9_CANBO|nr:unnamed protein product [[Candida] boidinii]GME91552.1 unnamed protein product [[Candida] boidinii]
MDEEEEDNGNNTNDDNELTTIPKKKLKLLTKNSKLSQFKHVLTGIAIGSVMTFAALAKLGSMDDTISSI